MPSVRPGLITVGTNDPRFHRLPFEGVVVAPMNCAPSTIWNAPVPSFRNNVVPHCGLVPGGGSVVYVPTTSRKPSLLMSIGHQILIFDASQIHPRRRRHVDELPRSLIQTNGYVSSPKSKRHGLAVGQPAVKMVMF